MRSRSDTGLRPRLELGASRLTAHVPASLKRLIAGKPIEIDGQILHPDAQAFLRVLDLLGEGEADESIAVERERVRRGARMSRGKPFAVGAIAETSVAGTGADLPARLYVPQGAAADGALLLYFHGGGFAVGDLDVYDQVCRFLCAEAGTRVLAPAYRHGPEHRFPAAHDDALAAYLDVVADPARFGAVAARIAVGGDSAGANLATWVARAARDRGAPPPAHQALIYPVCDRTRERRSHELFGRGFFLTRKRIAVWHGAYHSPEEAADPRLSPLLADCLSGLPPAEILAAGFDPLRDEGREYAERLRAAGNEVHTTLAPDLFHGFVNAVGVSPRFRDALAEFARRLRRRA